MLLLTDNRSAVLSVLASCVGLVKDALEEMEQVRDHLELNEDCFLIELLFM